MSDPVFTGYVDASIPEIHGSFPEFFDGLDLVVRCLDGSDDVVHLSKWIAYVHQKRFRYRPLGSSLWIAHEHVAEVFSDEVTFAGSDEIYLVKGMRAAKDIPAARYAPAAVRFGERAPASFLAGFERLKAAGFLSDGDGLNFACRSSGLASLIESAYDETD